MHNYTINELEEMVFSRSKAYNDSEAFANCLDFIKQVNMPMYKQELYREAIACGAIEETEDE